MKRMIWVGALLLSAGPAYAGWVGGAKLTDVNVSPDGYVAIGLAEQPANTCKNWSWHMRFNASTAGGKNIYSTLLAAKFAGHEVNIWYTDSSAPGTTQANGCNNATMSVLEAVSVP